MFALIGWFGTGCIVAAYILVSSGKVTGKSVSYQLLNLVGAAMLGIDVWVAGSMPAVALQLVWATVAIMSLVNIFWRDSPKRA